MLYDLSLDAGWEKTSILNWRKRILVSLIVFFSENPNVNNMYVFKCVFLNKWSRAPREAETKICGHWVKIETWEWHWNVQQTYFFHIKLILDTCSTT